MNNVKPIFDKYLTEEDYYALSQAVMSAYLACDQLMATNSIFTGFSVGRELRPHLLRVFVERALHLIPSTYPNFHIEITPNAAKNCSHVRLYRDNLVITSHFIGEKNFRNLGRPAINRAILASCNSDLFGEQFSLDLSDNQEHQYFQLLHGGSSHVPEILMLIKPSTNQQQILASYILPKTESSPIKSEQIIDEFKPRLRLRDLENEKII